MDHGQTGRALQNAAGNYYGEANTPVSPRDASEIQQAEALLRGAVHDLHGVLGALEERLSPILGPVYPTQSEDVTKAAQQERAPLVDDIRRSAENVANANAKISYILSRLAL